MCETTLKPNGFTLIEMALAMAISTFLIAALFVFYIPSVNTISSVMSSSDQQLNVSAAVQNIEQEASQMSSLVVDSSACYALCMVNPSGTRTYYYWGTPANGIATLYRKQESTTNAVSCSGGKTYAAGLNVAQTTFATNRMLLSVNMAGYGSAQYANVLFSALDSIFPSLQERSSVLSEDFECNSAKGGAGWTITPSSTATWRVQANSSLGHYQLGTTISTAGATTTTAATTIDLSRNSAAVLTFYYMNTGTISASDTFQVQFYDGSNTYTLYSDKNYQRILSPKLITLDLSGYNFAMNNQITFSATVSNLNESWFVDRINIATP